MAHRVCGLLGASTEPRDRVLVICGIGHSGYSHGVPERILARHPTLREARATYRIWSLPADGACALDDAASVRRLLADAFGPPGSTDPADLCLAFKQVALPAAAEAAPSADDAEAVKAATAAAYNQVGQTAHLGGDTRRAVSLLRRMRYLEHEIAAAGADAANWCARLAPPHHSHARADRPLSRPSPRRIVVRAHHRQGVGCPHRHAHLRSGETVVDLGSGLGAPAHVGAKAVAAVAPGAYKGAYDLPWQASTRSSPPTPSARPGTSPGSTSPSTRCGTRRRGRRRGSWTGACALRCAECRAARRPADAHTTPPPHAAHHAARSAVRASSAGRRARPGVARTDGHHQVGDLERVPLPDASADAVISNGTAAGSRTLAWRRLLAH